MLVCQYTFQRNPVFPLSLSFTQSLSQHSSVRAVAACGVAHPVGFKLRFHFNYSISVHLPGVLVLGVLFILIFVQAEIGTSPFEFKISPRRWTTSVSKSYDCFIHKGGCLIQSSTVSVPIFGLKISITLLDPKAGEPSCRFPFAFVWPCFLYQSVGKEESFY